MKYTSFCKAAGIDNDLQAQAIAGPIYGVGTLGIAPLVGTITGLSRKPMEDVEEVEDHPGASWLPGVATDRLIRRRTGLSKRHGGGKGKAVSELFGPFTATAAAALLGAGLGLGVNAVTKYSSPQFAAGRGAAAGLVAGATATALASIIAKAKRTPSREYFDKYETSGGATAQNWLIPGAASYNKILANKRIHDDEALSQDA